MCALIFTFHSRSRSAGARRFSLFSSSGGSRWVAPSSTRCRQSSASLSSSFSRSHVWSNSPSLQWRCSPTRKSSFSSMKPIVERARHNRQVFQSSSYLCDIFIFAGGFLVKFIYKQLLVISLFFPAPEKRPSGGPSSPPPPPLTDPSRQGRFTIHIFLLVQSTFFSLIIYCEQAHTQSIWNYDQLRQELFLLY